MIWLIALKSELWIFRDYFLNSNMLRRQNKTALLYNRAFNGALNGTWTACQFTESASPFLDAEFMKYCFSIPPSMRYKEKIYIEWILSRHPDAAKYVWEATKLKPSTNKVLPFIVKVFRRAYIKAFGKTNLLSMNPFQYWYKTNEQLRLFINNHFQQNIYLLDEYPELKSDSTRLFNEWWLWWRQLNFISVKWLFMGNESQGKIFLKNTGIVTASRVGNIVTVAVTGILRVRYLDIRVRMGKVRLR